MRRWQARRRSSGSTRRSARWCCTSFWARRVNSTWDLSRPSRSWPVRASRPSPETTRHDTSPSFAALAIGTGIVSIAGGILRLGWITSFLSRPILVGYVVGSGLIIARSQLEDALGIDHLGLGSLFNDLADIHWWTFALTAISVTVVLVLRQLGPRVPHTSWHWWAPPCCWLCWTSALTGWPWSAPSTRGLPSVGVPDLSLGDIPSLVGPSAAIALLMFADSMLTVKSLAKSNDYDVDPNQEFFALGAADVGSGLLGGFPANGSQSRSVVNDAAGCSHAAVNAVAVVLVVITLLFLTPLFDEVPRARSPGSSSWRQPASSTSRRCGASGHSTGATLLSPCSPPFWWCGLTCSPASWSPS